MQDKDTVTGQEEQKVNLPEDASDLQLFLEFYRLLSEEIRLIRLRIQNPFCEPSCTHPQAVGNESLAPQPESATPDLVQLALNNLLQNFAIRNQNLAILVSHNEPLLWSGVLRCQAC
jgi:hypothetical protein